MFLKFEFQDDRSTNVGTVGGLNLPFPIDKAHRLYNSLLLPHKPWLWNYLLPFSRYWRLKLENGWFFPPHPRLTLPLGWNPSEFRDETYCAKTKWMGLPYGKNFIILTSTVLYGVWHPCDRRTVIAYSTLRVRFITVDQAWTKFKFDLDLGLAVIFVASSQFISNHELNSV